MLNLAEVLKDLPEGVGTSPFAGQEYVRGWGVFGLPFDSGHVLALRVFPESTFGAYRTVWHRTPDGTWSIHVHGSAVENACPRYYGSACSYTGLSRIDLEWEGPSRLRVRMDSPALDWTINARSNPLMDLMNSASARMPSASWRPRPLVRARELMAKRMGLGDIAMHDVMPSGHTGTLMPGRMYFVDDSTAVLEGEDLGRPVHARENPRIGGVALPARGILAIGEAAWEPLP
jgi:hypothetical protein